MTSGSSIVPRGALRVLLRELKG
ncbi:uncharacterized protein METZ01_LOCUS126328 [marine metagenome]|uniref:Uncharacterized protein n=1 Tax=marine metagenome TaxID=408172 RepID=A0A381Y8Y7_9ZZZZ